MLTYSASLGLFLPSNLFAVPSQHPATPTKSTLTPPHPKHHSSLASSFLIFGQMAHLLLYSVISSQYTFQHCIYIPPPKSILPSFPRDPSTSIQNSLTPSWTLSDPSSFLLCCHLPFQIPPCASSTIYLNLSIVNHP